MYGDELIVVDSEDSMAAKAAAVDQRLKAAKDGTAAIGYIICVTRIVNAIRFDFDLIEIFSNAFHYMSTNET